MLATTHALLSSRAQPPGGERTAVEDPTQSLTFRELNRQTLALACNLLAQGVRPGDVVAVTGAPGVRLSVAFLSVSRLGAAVVHLHGLLRPPEIMHVLTLLRPRGAIGPVLDVPGLEWLTEDSMTPTAGLAQAVDEDADSRLQTLWPAWQPPAPERILQYRLTSGTTGHPKVIPLTHRQVWRRASDPGLWYLPARRHGCCLPHAFPSYQCLTAWGSGGCVVFEPAVTAAQVENFVRGRRIEMLWSIPAMYELVARQREPLMERFPCLQAAVSSGSALAPDCARAVMRRWGVPLWQGYGQSELGFLTEAGPDTPPESVGRAVPGVRLRIVDPQGRVLPAGDKGCIHARSDCPFPGYVGGEPSPVLPDGWIATGDLGRLDAQGCLYVSGREVGMIHVAGCKVHADEVAAIVRACPGVGECAVFAVHHPVRGEVVMAAVAPVAGAVLDVATVRKFCRRHLAGWKCPRRVAILPQLPRNALGKVDLAALRAQAE